MPPKFKGYRPAEKDLKGFQRGHKHLSYRLYPPFMEIWNPNHPRETLRHPNHGSQTGCIKCNKGDFGTFESVKPPIPCIGFCGH